MSKTVVLAEKPSVGRDLARVLKCHKKGNGYLEGDQYIVTWALGHLVTLADPEGYGKEFQSWRLEDLPIIPEPLKLVVIKKTGKQFNAVKSQLTRKDVNQIVIATDAGREGELVARWIIEKANVRKPIKRLWISSVTDKAIKEGFQKLRSGKEYENLYHSAVARAEADWIVGDQRHPCTYHEIQCPALMRACADSDACHDCKARGRHSSVYARSVLRHTCCNRWHDADVAG
ncbi:DNA topoisomerase IA [Bacillus subtilis]